MRTRYRYIVRSLLVLTDLLFVIAAYLICYQLIVVFHKPLDWGQYRGYMPSYLLLWMMGAIVFNLYRSVTVRAMERLFTASWRTLLLQQAVFWMFLLFTKDDVSRMFLMVLLATNITGMLFSRFMITAVEIWYRRHWKVKPTVAILGFNSTGIQLAEYLQRHARDQKFKGFLDEVGDLDNWETQGQVRRQMEKAIKYASDKQIREVYACIPPSLLHEVRPLMLLADDYFVRLRLVPDLTGALAARLSISYLGHFAVMSMRHEPLENMHNRFKKRLFDLVVSALVIVFIMSWLVPVIAFIIKRQSPGPVFFKQQRSGRNNKSFWCYKFRSMRVNDDSDNKQATAGDDRITPIGRILRKTSLDEMPQFLNVLKGEMSVVGPRPHMLSHTEQYSKIIDGFMVRHFLKPGITGWAQVTGFRGETKDPKLMEERVVRDVWYLENWQLLLDVRIMFLTIWVVIKGDEKAF